MTLLPRMETFAAVAEARSFSQAARKLGLSKGAVSKAIAALEDELGARLLHRSTRNVALTEAGELFYASCRRILDEAAGAERSVRELSDSPRGLIKVNASTAFAGLWLAPGLGEFLRQYPEVQVDLEGSDHYVDVARGGYDVVIRIGRLVDSGLIVRKLSPVRLVFVASPAYLERAGTPRKPEDLKDHPCVLYSLAEAPDRWPMQRKGKKLPVRVHGRLKVNSDAATRGAVLEGLGIGMLPAFCVAADLQAGTLVPVLTSFEPPPLAMHALMPPGAASTAKVRAFVEFLVARFAKGGIFPCAAAAESPPAGARATATAA
jgi:DNA-binding transcriptional LysR family regulator